MVGDRFATRCRSCRGRDLVTVLDLGRMPAADHFPPAGQPVRAAEAAHSLTMRSCRGCGLAQLGPDDTDTAEPRGIEPLALREQAADAVDRVARAGLLRGRTVREFGSPHGGSWLDLLARRGFTPVTGQAEVVLDSFGLMHEPDQYAAVVERAAATAPGGLLLVQYHSLHTIVAGGQWNALRHGHFAYYTLSALAGMLRGAGLAVRTAWDFDLYGGTVLIAAERPTAAVDRGGTDPRVARVYDREAGLEDPAALGDLQRAADRHAQNLREVLEDAAAEGSRVFAYGAASRAVALLHRAGVHRGLLHGVADASPAKQGRRMPGTDVPIISPADLVAAQPDRVLLTVPDLRAEVEAAYPELAGRWLLDTPPAIAEVRATR
ncbi:class I SAM-dependent methyltransferase [Nocardia takedensis]|uniref:class I SAM-dependent methyltransferase n=1 Tax=Nocardia takedensis TaxID=259390 RepID=UPI0005947570|nr:class I SAM-dependent methyltransferase [Nocardia takedensis]